MSLTDSKIQMQRVEDKKVRAATLFQSIYRGYIVRKYITYPERLLSFSQLKEPDSLLLAKRICREATLYLLENYAKKEVTGKACYYLQNKVFYLKWDKSQKLLAIILPDEPQTLRGKGTFKKYYDSRTIMLLTHKKEERPLSVLSVLAEPVHQPELNTIKTGNQALKTLHKMWQEEKPEGVYLTDPLDVIVPGVYHQSRFETDFRKFAQQPENQKAVIQCLEDMTKTLLWIQSKGFVHTDVKRDNVLVNKHPDHTGQLRYIAYLSDFDYADTPGTKSLDAGDPYVFWDPCMSFANIKTPYVDLWGLCISYLETFVPSDSLLTLLPWVRYTVWEDQSYGRRIDPLYYWNHFFPYQGLGPEQKDIWNLTIAVCKESVRLYEKLRFSRGSISKEEIDLALDKLSLKLLSEGCLHVISLLKTRTSTSKKPKRYP